MNMCAILLRKVLGLGNQPLTATLVLTLLAACASAPTMKDVTEVSASSHIAYGSVAVFEGEEQEKWGLNWKGDNRFFLTILPDGATEAITYAVDKDGVFYWDLAPGSYMLLGYHWSHEGENLTGRIGAEFTIPADGGDSYLGSLELHAYNNWLIPMLKDDFEQMAQLFDRKFPQRAGMSKPRMMDSPAPLGEFADTLYQCDESWGIECDKRYRGVTPMSPEVTSFRGPPRIETLRPKFQWNPSSDPEVTYDLVIYEAVAYNPAGMSAHMKGRVARYQEDLQEPSWQCGTPLKPDTHYFWSVRLRRGDVVSPWSTQGHNIFLIVVASRAFGQWFEFVTPAVG